MDMTSKEPLMPTDHRIPATPETIRWGTFDGSFKPIRRLYPNPNVGVFRGGAGSCLSRSDEQRDLKVVVV